MMLEPHPWSEQPDVKAMLGLNAVVDEALANGLDRFEISAALFVRAASVASEDERARSALATTLLRWARQLDPDVLQAVGLRQ